MESNAPNKAFTNPFSNPLQQGSCVLLSTNRYVIMDVIIDFLMGIIEDIINP